MRREKSRHAAPPARRPAPAGEWDSDAVLGLIGFFVLLAIGVVCIIGHFYNEHLDAVRAEERRVAWAQSSAETRAFQDCLDDHARRSQFIREAGRVPNLPACRR